MIDKKNNLESEQIVLDSIDKINDVSGAELDSIVETIHSYSKSVKNKENVVEDLEVC